MKTWFITGCSTGFGRELAKKALDEGDAVVVTARNLEKIKDFESYENAKLVSCDVTDVASVKAAVKEAIAWKNQLDVVVNNAGFGNIGAIEETSDESFRQMYEVNVFGVLNVLRETLPQLRSQKSGHIINVSSIAGLTSMPGLGAYCSTKFALEGISEALAGEVAPLGIKVTLIEPGAFKTNFVGNVAEEDRIADYDATAGPMRAMIKSMAEGAAGDPVKAAKVMFDVVSMSEPPLRLLLGSDAFEWAGQKVAALKEQVTAHEAISKSTDF